MNAQQLKRQSKHLSWLLRHGAIESGLHMDPAGWASIDAVLAVARMSRAVLDATVAQNSKRRLQVCGDRIRASQGHSLAGTPVTRAALEDSWAVWDHTDSLWHGTYPRAIEGIAAEGILSQHRSHVHLVPTPESRVGKRAGVGVLLEVSPAALRAADQGIFISPNGVVLVRHVPPHCIVGIRPLTRRARSEAAAMRALLGLPS